jgi:spermidine synthase
VTRFALHILFFLSGVAALGYQLVWAKMFSTGLGHEMPAVLAIIAAFMVGMALGAWTLDRFIPRDMRAGFWLAGIELTIGAWALLASFFIPSVNEFALRWIGLAPGAFKHWLIAFAIPAIVLLPATTAIGATLPAMEKFLSALAPQNQSIGSVYAANTFGAVVGTLVAPFALMPVYGFSGTCVALVMVNCLVAAEALALSAGSAHILPASSSSSWLEAGVPGKHADSAVRAPLSSRRLTVSLFITGLLGISYEVAGVRVLSQVLEGTVFTYAAVLAIFLLGTAAGAAAFHRWWRGVDPARLHAHLLNVAACAGFLGILALSRTPLIYRTLRALGDAPGAVLAAELLTACTVFAPVTFCMGALFSHLLEQVRARGARIGGVLALNTLGAALAPAFVLLLLPWAGAKITLGIACLGYLLLALPDFSTKFIGVVFVLGLFANRSNLQIVDVPPGGRIVSHREGIMATVVVTEESNTNRTLRVDNRYQMGGTAAADAEYRQAHLPLLFHPNSRRALFLGVGTGISFGAASLYPNLEADGVELVPEVVEVMPAFAAKNFSPAQNPNLKLHVADARRFVRAREPQPGYDVIVADLFHPYRDGAGALYTREHFTAIRRQLNSNAPSLFCQWLPLHQLDDPTLRVIIRTFQSVFPDGEAWLLRFNVEVPVIALVGWTAPPRWSPAQVEPRLDAALGAELKRLALADSLRLYGHLLADAEDLHRFADGAPLNTDDNQRVTFMAPRAAYQHDAKPYASLLALMAVSKTAGTVEERLPGTDAEFARRLTPYLAARNVYLRGLIHESEQRRDEAIDSYIESARLSADFTTGYAQALSIATVLAGSDPVRARRILERLNEAQPERPVAKQILERLFPK